MNARVTGIVNACMFDHGDEIHDDRDCYIGQKVKVGRSYGDTYDIEEFENHVIDHEFYRYQITTDNFEFLGEIIT